MSRRAVGARWFVLAATLTGLTLTVGPVRAAEDPRTVSRFELSSRYASPSFAQYCRASSRQMQRSGRTTPSSRLVLIPFAVPLVTSR